MTTNPPPTRYHRWLGWYAPAMRRAVIVSSIGLTVVVVLAWFVPWGMAVVAGEITTKTYVHIPEIVRSTIESIGYTDATFGFDARTCAVISSIDRALT